MHPLQKPFALGVLLLAALNSSAQSTATSIPPAEAQIKSAVLAAPADKQAGAAVWGYNQNGEFTMLRKGTNEMVCLADDPNSEGFSASCYHKDLEPFMARGRELKKSGKNFQQIFDTREQEAKSGKLRMPAQPSTLFVLNAPKENYNAATGEVKDAYLRYVVYIPYATAEGTGLPLKPEAPGMPWIMYPGTHGAHIMINPPKN
ncbi:hypothetical protein [Cesiribacter sp. SM1]|uniref:hypothetical protein n=1 Tax=Cesiribacter sp. SM1 TaxID=2861196 RepID=UPI001CD42875|nr:hypothetical protein [Cesiribacter sp. SM1]